jgi:hypothetical protein
MYGVIKLAIGKLLKLGHRGSVNLGNRRIVGVGPYGEYCLWAIEKMEKLLLRRSFEGGS